MVDHVRTLLLNPVGLPGYSHVVDGPSDAVLQLFGIAAGSPDVDVAVDRVMPLAMAPDLARFRRFFDQRTTPAQNMSVYGQTQATLSLTGLRRRVLSGDGWWDVSALFSSDDADALQVLTEMRVAAASQDAPYALGAVLLACAYRRLLLQGGGVAA